MSPLLQEGLNVTAIGMGVVFVLLALLVGIIRGMSVISQKIEQMMPASPETGGPTTSSLSQQELHGVISAAITAHRERRPFRPPRAQ